MIRKTGAGVFLNSCLHVAPVKLHILLISGLQTLFLAIVADEKNG